VQDNVLAKLGDRDVKVFVVWLAMRRTDARSEWPRNEIVDPRATHFWDERKAVGTALAARDDLKSWRPVAWDIWAMFPAGTIWIADVPRPIASGHTVIGTRDQLEAAVAALPPRQAQ
jgi:hypothetical protein